MFSLVGMILFITFLTTWGLAVIFDKILVPVVKVVGKTAMAVGKWLFWLGFLGLVAATPAWYRAFGWSILSIDEFEANDRGEATIAVCKSAWRQEDEVTPSGDIEPHWRENRGEPPLDPKWCGTPEPYHWFPWWSSVFVPLGIIVLFKVTNQRKSERINRIAQKRHELDESENRKIDQQFKALIAEIEGGMNGWNNHIEELNRQSRGPAQTEDQAVDRDFTMALRNLGYRKADIDRVKQQCRGSLEDKIRQALVILNRRSP